MIKLNFERKDARNRAYRIKKRQRVNAPAVMYTFNYIEYIRIHPLKDSRRLRNSVKHLQADTVVCDGLLSVCLSSIPAFGQASHSLRPRAPGVVVLDDLKSPLVPFLGPDVPLRPAKYSLRIKGRKVGISMDQTNHGTSIRRIYILISSAANARAALTYSGASDTAVNN